MSGPSDDSLRGAQPSSGDTEELDAVPVGDERELQPYSPAAIPIRAQPQTSQLALTAAVAASSFIAGAAVIGLAHRRNQGALSRGARRGRRQQRREILQIVGSRSLLVDVHLLGGPGRDR